MQISGFFFWSCTRLSVMSISTQTVPANSIGNEDTRWLALQAPGLQAATWTDADSLRRKYLDQIRRNAGPFTDEGATSDEFLAQFEKFKIL